MLHLPVNGRLERFVRCRSQIIRRDATGPRDLLGEQTLHRHWVVKNDCRFLHEPNKRFSTQMSLSPCADLSQFNRGHFQETVEPPFGRGGQIRTGTNAEASTPLMSVETLIVFAVIVLVAVVITAVAGWIIW